MAKFPRPPLASIAVNAHMQANDHDGRTTVTRPTMNGKGDKRGPKAWCREIAAAWIVGGAIWVAGVGGLAAVSAPEADGAMAAGGFASYLQPSQSWSTYQDPSGKYTVVVRSFQRVLAN
jgi:hypothetical protein